MDYERKNAQEWLMNSTSGANAASSDSDASFDDDHPRPGPEPEPELSQAPADYENPDDDGSEWQQVTYKKQPKASAKLPAKPPAKLPPKPPAKPITRFLAKSPVKPTIRVPPNKAPPPAKRLPVAPPSRPRAPLPPQLPKRRMVLFSHKTDNLARAAFRAQQPNTNVFVLSKNCYAIEPERERLYDILEEMGVRIGSFIRPPQSATDRKLLLWGTEEQTNTTIRELNRWVTQSNVESYTTRHGTAFAKIGQLSQDKAEKLDRDMRWLATKIRYQKKPDADLTFSQIGYFLWPVDEIRPEELLGPSYEAFDPIRMDYHSYILFNNQLSSFQILSHEVGAVKNAMKRIQGTMKEFVARNSREILVHMVEKPQARLMREGVKLKDVTDMGQEMELAKIPLLTGKHLSPLGLADWDRERLQTEEHQFAYWRQTLDKALKRLRHYRGHVRMRVLLGTFALTTFRRWPEGVNSIPFQKFVKDMDLTATKGRLIKDLQEKNNATVLFSNICNATGIFAPVDVMTTKLHTVVPMYTACFDFDIPGTGQVRLEMEIGRPGGGGGLYEATRSQWTRRTDKTEAVHPVEVFVIRLNDGISWQLQVSTPVVLDTARITPTMDEFISTVEFNPPPPGAKPDADPHRCFTWKAGGLRVSSFEQKTSLRYRIRDESRWMFEFSRYDLYRGHFVTAKPTTQWGATFWNSEWDRVFKENSKAAIGNEANWEPQVKTFFPARQGTEDADGLRAFLQRTKTIAEVLDGMAAEDSSDG